MGLLFLCLLAVFSVCTTAWPARGHYPFAVALCYTYDNTRQPMTTDYVRLYLTSANPTAISMYDFLQEQSNNKIDIDGTTVSGWYQIALSSVQINSFSLIQKLNACRDAAVNAGFVIPSVWLHLQCQLTGITLRVPDQRATNPKAC